MGTKPNQNHPETAHQPSHATPDTSEGLETIRELEEDGEATPPLTPRTVASTPRIGAMTGSSCGKAELVNKLKALGKRSSGNKPDLIARCFEAETPQIPAGPRAPSAIVVDLPGDSLEGDDATKRCTQRNDLKLGKDQESTAFQRIDPDSSDVWVGSFAFNQFLSRSQGADMLFTLICGQPHRVKNRQVFVATHISFPSHPLSDITSISSAVADLLSASEGLGHTPLIPLRAGMKSVYICV